MSNRHRIIGQRVCEACGGTFDVPSRNPGQRFCNRLCGDTGRRRASVAVRLRSVRAQRRARWGQQVAAIAEQGRITEGDLLQLCADVYRGAYQAGYQRAEKRFKLREAS